LTIREFILHKVVRIYSAEKGWWGGVLLAGNQEEQAAKLAAAGIKPLGRCSECHTTYVRDGGDACDRCNPPAGRHVIGGKIVVCADGCKVCAAESSTKGKSAHVLPLRREGKTKNERG